MYDEDWMQIVYLALENGANPNVYIDVDEDVKYHILYYLDQLTLINSSYYDEEGMETENDETTEDMMVLQQVIKNTICVMLIIYGSDPMMEVTDVSRREKERMSKVQLLLRNPDASNAVITAIKNKYLDLGDEYSRITYKLYKLAYKKGRSSIGDIVALGLLPISYATRIGVLLDSPEILAQMDALDDLDTIEECIALFSNNCVKESISLIIDLEKLEKGGDVFMTDEDKEVIKNLFYTAVETYNVHIIPFILSLGIEP